MNEPRATPTRNRATIGNMPTPHLHINGITYELPERYDPAGTSGSVFLDDLRAKIQEAVHGGSTAPFSVALKLDGGQIHEIWIQPSQVAVIGVYLM